MKALASNEAILTRRATSKFNLGWLWQFWNRKPLGAICGVIVFLITLMAIFAPVLAPYDPNALDYDSPFAPPSAKHLLGADNQGRDILSRVIFGARPSLVVGYGAVGFGITLGALAGLVSGYIGGRLDLFIQRIVDILMAFPALVLAMTIVAAIGPSTLNVLIAIGIVRIPWGVRVIRSSTLSIRENQYIEAARSIGCPTSRILLRHIMPNCMASFIIIVTASIAAAILTEASLSFLGLGTQPPEASWGRMLSGHGQTYATIAPWMAIFPGLAITIVVFAFSLLGDAMRDVWDPRLRSG